MRISEVDLPGRWYEVVTGREKSTRLRQNQDKGLECSNQPSTVRSIVLTDMRFFGNSVHACLAKWEDADR